MSAEYIVIYVCNISWNYRIFLGGTLCL